MKTLLNLIIYYQQNKMRNLIIIILTILLQACNSGNKVDPSATPVPVNENTAALTAKQLKNSDIIIGKIEQQSIPSIIKLNGQIDVPPQNLASVSAPLGGYLKSITLMPGMSIRKGEIIAKMEDQQYIQLQQDYLSTKSRLVFAEKEYQRQKELNQSQASSDKIFQQAESEYRMLRINLSGLAEKLKLINVNPAKLSEKSLSKTINIYSPITGFVSKVNVNIGKYVNPSDVLFELVNPTDIHLNLKVFEKDVNKLYIGQNVIAYSNNQPDKKYHAEIILISKDFSPNHTAEVHCHFLEYDKSLFPGMYMNADIEIKSNNAFNLPEDAIVNFEGKEFIFIASKDNQFTMTEVKTGNTNNGRTEIENSTALLGKSIVTKGAYTLLMKMKNKSDE